MLGPDDLVLCSGTVIQAGIPEMVQAAVAGGFRGITIWAQDYRRARADGWSDADLRALIADHGLEVTDLDALLTWLPEEAELARRLAQIEVADEAEFFRIGEALGGRTLNVVQGFGTHVDLDRAAEALAGLCDRAALRGLVVTLEFLPWSGIRDAATAFEIVQRCGRPNATLMLDTWHLFRSGGDERSLSGIPGSRIGGVQINDAPATGPGDAEEAMQARLLPGAGEIPLGRILRALRQLGVRAPTGVEVFSSELAALPPVEVGRRAGAAGRRALELARQGGGGAA